MFAFTSENNNNNKNLHDSIFSPYLNTNEGKFIERIGESSQKTNPFISSRNSPLHQVEKTEESGEIGVFGAEKYFNRKVVESPRAATKYLPDHRDETTDTKTRKYQVEYGTSSISSISTLNSQNPLLKRDSVRNSKDKVHAKSVLSSLGLKCYCADKNSVDISDHAGEISFNNKTSNYGAVHGKTTPRKVFNLGLDDDLSVKIRKPSSEHFNKKDVFFQKQKNLSVGSNSEKNSVASNSRNHLVKMQFPLDEEKTPRKSLEVFGSPNPILINNKRSSLSIDKRLLLPSKMEEIVDANYDDDDDDAGSDASSDLFEIESLKGKSSNNFHTRQTSDAASSCVSPTCYAPSEASIEWSVVTASAAVMSDCEDQMSEFTVRSPIKITREVPRRRPGILLGCKSHKAVRVAGDAFITYGKQSLSPNISNRNKNNTSPQVARFPGETKSYAKTRHGQQALQASNSPHASKLLFN
ncbi:protein PHYTOCHROME KINASE SUBSTRATE 1-like [Vicia villosa]|uniref:protein PHYTOCHROME KINASE SUBSTRATE 1-like n=1 Tax=Vicia villosa TaxID=3911 RepID=UPI00273B9593|nr:protein PHYTOCHROME KINASE SUBSTRATE 1-like [Vicia villosa]